MHAVPERGIDMTSHARSIKHGSFVIERHLHYDPAALFRAWTDPKAKARWFNGPADKDRTGPRDGRAGRRPRAGRRQIRGRFGVRFEALYFDVVPERRLVYTYDMYFQGKLICVLRERGVRAERKTAGANSS